MEQIMLNSFTTAMRAKELLSSSGITVGIEKRTSKKSGCGYILVLYSGNIQDVKRILTNNGIKFKIADDGEYQ